ncbi:hypothetical protein GCM10022237_00870 [Nocardioides ginsengisoli]|uniref:Uncharacterized protein n=1 Tax=Nocardioides ginsengisoli TaxID=363868 RepID=A0ABW3W1J9_9ACTN
MLSQRSRGVRVRRRWLRLAVPAVLLTTWGLLTLPADARPGVPPSYGVRGVGATAPAAQVPAGCRPTSNPPPTEYGFAARVEQASINAGALRIADLDVSICGILRLVSSPPGTSCPVSTELHVPADGVKVTALKAVFDIIPGKPLEVPVTMRARPTVSLISCEGDSANGFKARLDLALEGRAGLFGLQCAIPFTGIASSVITGPLLSPPYEGQATLKGSDFTVAKVTNHDKYCPGQLPARVGRLAGLPITKVPIDLKAKIAVYQPGA